MSKQDERDKSMMDIIREDIEENKELYEALAADTEERKESKDYGFGSE